MSIYSIDVDPFTSVADKQKVTAEALGEYIPDMFRDKRIKKTKKLLKKKDQLYKQIEILKAQGYISQSDVVKIQKAFGKKILPGALTIKSFTTGPSTIGYARILDVLIYKKSVIAKDLKTSKDCWVPLVNHKPYYKAICSLDKYLKVIDTAHDLQMSGSAKVRFREAKAIWFDKKSKQTAALRDLPGVKRILGSDASLTPLDALRKYLKGLKDTLRGDLPKVTQEVVYETIINEYITKMNACEEVRILISKLP